MTCLGRAYVYWKEVENVGHKGGRQRVEAVENTAEEEYFNFRFPIWPQDGEFILFTLSATLPLKLNKKSSAVLKREIKVILNFPVYTGTKNG